MCVSSFLEGEKKGEVLRFHCEEPTRNHREFVFHLDLMAAYDMYIILFVSIV